MSKLRTERDEDLRMFAVGEARIIMSSPEIRKDDDASVMTITKEIYDFVKGT